MESVVRGLAMYLILLVVFRLAGKRTLSETSSFDLVLLLIISETTQQAMVDSDHSLTNAVVLILTLVCADVLLSLWKQRSKLVQRAVDAAPVVIVQDGRMLAEAANAERIDEQEIMEAARRQMGLESLSQIRFAVLEGSGKITVVPK
jgi:uncharacterized membrane protein YcaP (DUF421 family)